MNSFADLNFISTAGARLEKEWRNVSQSDQIEADEPALPEAVRQAIRRCINSSTKSYRYVLPTQLLAKLVDHSLDCRAIQEGSELPGSFDARSLCHKVLVPFDRHNHDVLGGAPEPYVNNPLRIPSITPERRAAQRNKEGFDDLCTVLFFAEQNVSQLGHLFQAVLLAIRDRLQTVHINYPVPNRVSLKQALTVVDAFLSEKTGGVRLQATALALFRCLGEKLSLYHQVTSQKVDAADAQSGKAADLDCRDSSGQPVMAVEVKDRMLELRHVQDKLPGIREKHITELLFLIQGGVRAEDEAAINQLIDHEFVTGQNIYKCEFQLFLQTILTLLREQGRTDFLKQIGVCLGELNADLIHRQQWRDLLSRL